MSKHYRPRLIPALLMAAAIGGGSLFAQYFYTNPPDSVRYLSPNRNEFVIGGDTVHLQFIDDAEAATSPGE